MDAEYGRRTRMRAALEEIGIDTSKVFDVTIGFPFGQPAVVTVSFFAPESIFQALTAPTDSDEGTKGQST